MEARTRLETTDDREEDMRIIKRSFESNDSDKKQSSSHHVCIQSFLS